MFRKPRNRLFRRMKREIAKIKMEFATEEFTNTDLSSDLDVNLNLIKKELNSSSDLIIRRFSFGSSEQGEGAIIFIDGLVDKKQIEWSILRPLMLMTESANVKPGMGDPLEYIESSLITVGEIKREYKFDRIISAILFGKTVLLINGFQGVLTISTPGWEKRGIEEPESEVIVRGPREGFVETLRTNTALLRRKLGDPGLTFETFQVGQRTKTDICIAYLKDIADLKVIKELKQRIKRIDTDGILAAGVLEEYIEDNPLSIFATIGYTERPDVVSAKLLEGRAAILVDGTPVVLTVPFLFIENFQSPDDYNLKPIFSSIFRLVRYTAFFISISLPALYVAITAFHQELLPTQLLITVAAATEGIPFPGVIEALLMGLFFEFLREAGVRLPRAIGQTVSFIGALVIGETTVSAGLVGAPLLIVIALTAISLFVSPPLFEESIIIRFSLTILAGFLGAFGIAIGLLLFLIHLASLRSFGVSILSPIVPMDFRGLAQDVIIRAPWWAMFTRPKALNTQNRTRQDFYSRPQPPQKGTAEDEDETFE